MFIGRVITSSQVLTAVCEQVALDQSLPYVVTANDTETMFTGIQGSNFVPQRPALLTAPIGQSPRDHRPLLVAGDVGRVPRTTLQAMRGREVTQQQQHRHLLRRVVTDIVVPRLNLRWDLCVIRNLQLPTATDGQEWTNGAK